MTPPINPSSADDLQPTLVPGDSISVSRYRIIAPLGAGGMGEVFKAHDPNLDRVVALKLPRVQPGGDDEVLRKRFLREARAAAKVRHVHVCPIYDCGEEGGRLYLVMALVEGESLADRLKRTKKLEPAEAVRIARQVTSGLQAIHEAGLVHRDLKPGNILLEKDGTALVTDFGLVRTSRQSELMTAPGAVMGTPSYMSPEQASGQEGAIGPRSDIYSLGVILYEMLSGRLPFEDTFPAILWKITHGTPDSLRDTAPHVDAELVRIVERATARDPEQRFAGAAEMLTALQAWPSAPTVDEHHSPYSTPTVAEKPHEPSDTFVLPTPRKPRRFPLKLGIAILLLLLLPGLVWLLPRLMKGDQKPDPSPPIPPRFRISERDVLVAMRDHLHAAPEAERKYYRFLSLAPLCRDRAISDDYLQETRDAAAQVVKCLRSKPGPVTVKTLGPEGSVLAFDVRELDWDEKMTTGVGHPWHMILRHYPYGLRYDTQGEWMALGKEVQSLSGEVLPCVRADWFVATVLSRFKIEQWFADSKLRTLQLSPDVVKHYHEDLSKARVLADLGLEESEMLDRLIKSNRQLRERGLGSLLGNGSISRKEWEATGKGLYSLLQMTADELKIGEPYNEQ